MLLEHGWDSPALRVAAGADNAEPEEQRASMQAALEELDQLPIGPEEVAARFTTHWAKRLLRGDVAPLDAAGQFWLLSHSHGIRFPEDFVMRRLGGSPTAEVHRRTAAETWACLQSAWLSNIATVLALQSTVP
jgi:hypothetical protein